MIKGHVRIDLHDTKTGSNEKIEKDNLVTGAVAKLLPFQFGKRANDLYSYDQDSLNRYVFPLATKVLGGVMLFDGALTEDASHFRFPSEAHLVGFAGRSNDTSHACMGSFNSLESGPSGPGYTSVWDFSTSQCNGTIGSLGLTHSYISNGLFAGSGLRGYDDWSYDEGRQLYYYVGNAEIRRRRAPNTRFRLNDTLWNTFNDELVRNTLDDDGTFNNVYQQYYNKYMYTYNYDSSGARYHYVGFNEFAGFFYGWDGYLYLIFQTGLNYRLNTFYVKKYKCDDWSFTPSETVSFTVSTANLSTANNKKAVSNGYLYMVNYDNAREVYRINLSNTVDVIKYTLEKPAYRLNALPYGGCKVHYDSNSYDGNIAYGILYPDRRIADFRDAGTLPYSPWAAGGYLGTICNLPSPISKNPSQTMKITYSLTDTQED